MFQTLLFQMGYPNQGSMCTGRPLNDHCKQLKFCSGISRIPRLHSPALSHHVEKLYRAIKAEEWSLEMRWLFFSHVVKIRIFFLQHAKKTWGGELTTDRS